MRHWVITINQTSTYEIIAGNALTALSKAELQFVVDTKDHAAGMHIKEISISCLTSQENGINTNTRKISLGAGGL